MNIRVAVSTETAHCCRSNAIMKIFHKTNHPLSRRNSVGATPSRRLAAALLAAAFAAAFFAPPVLAMQGVDGRLQPSTSLSGVVAAVQPKVVKIYGAGGLQGMEAYQSGMLISPEGHVLTAWSHVLDCDTITVVLSDGRKLEAKLLGADPRLDVAVLKIEGKQLPAFRLDEAVEADVGTRVLALSNLFGVATGNEPASVQHGTISVRTDLSARRGTYETPYHGPVYVLDVVTNNPGAQGGALVTRQGQLLGMLGKELRSTLNNTWLNYSIPIAQLRSSVEAIRAGKFTARADDPATKKPERSVDLPSLGLALVPDVVARTPPYVDRVHADSPAARADVHPDDLVLLVGDHLVSSCRAVSVELEQIDHEDPVKLTLQRGQDICEVTLQSTAGRPLSPPGSPAAP